MAKIKLRAYQRKAVANLLLAVKERRKIVAVAPTGSGKTVIGAALIRALKGKRILWLAHRIELLTQARDQIVDAGMAARDVGILSGVFGAPATQTRVLVASVPMLRSRDVPRVDLVVVDEAHHVEAASYQRILSRLPGVPVVGLTATPWRLDGKGLGETFDDLLVMAGPTELAADGFIAAPVTYGITSDGARKLVAGVATSKGDYSPGALRGASRTRALQGNVVTECARLAPNAQTLVFAVSREHGKKLAARFKRAGRTVEYLDGETPSPDRAAILERLRTGATQVVVNVDVLTEGFDCPPVKCVSMARPTRSLTRFLQYCGRVSRPFKGQRPVIIDHAGNCYRLGLPMKERDWTLEGEDKSAAKKSAPLRQCEECGALIHASLRECPECGAEQREVVTRELKEEAARLEELRMQEKERGRVLGVLRRLAVERKDDLAKAKMTAEEWIAEAAKIMGIAA